MSEESLKLRLAEFKGLIMGVLADEVLVLPEISMLKHWIENHPDLKQQEPFSHVYQMARDIHSELDSKQIELLKESLYELIGVAKIEPAARAEKYGILLDDFRGELKPCDRICFCGNIESSRLDVIKSQLLEKDIELDESVRLNTKLLVIGKLEENWHSSNWATLLEQAISYREMGTGLKIIDEQNFLKLF